MRLRSGLTQLRLLAALLTFSSVSFASDVETYEGRTITAIRFDPEVQSLPAADLALAIQPLKVGETFRSRAIRDAMEKLFATGRYRDIAVDAQLEGDGVVLSFLTVSEAFVRDVRVIGAPEPPSNGQLTNTTKFELGQPFRRPQVQQATQSIMDVLRLNGLYQAKVQAETEPVPIANQIDVRFKVDPGDRAGYDQPVIISKDLKNTEENVIKATRWRKFLRKSWREVSENRTSQGIDRIRKSYQKKDYLMARVSLDQMAYDEATNRVTPHVLVEAGPKVRVITEGARVSKGKLRQLIPVYQEQAVDKDLLVEGRRNLLEYLEGEGYFEADVTFDRRQTQADEETIVYDIARGDRHRLVHLELAGNRYFDDATLRERMYMTTATILRFRHGRYSADYLKRDINAIKDLYRANGFRDVEATSRVEDDWRKENEVAVFITVKEGPQWLVDKLEIQGASETNRSYIEGILQSGEGQPFSDYNLATDQDNILTNYYNNGYPNATLEANVTPASAPNRMNVTYTVKEGKREYVRDVLVSGFTVTDPDLIRSRIRNLAAGDPLSQSAMIENQRRLYDLGIFARVDAGVQNPDGETDQKYVLYRFEEARRYSLNLGFGAEIARIGGGSATNLVAAGGSTGFGPRVSVGISRNNFFGQGHTLSLQGRLSNFQRRALLTYFAPQFKGKDDVNLSFTGLYDDARDVNTFNSIRQEGFIQLQQRLSKANSAAYRLGFRRVSVDPNSVKIRPELIPLASQPVRLAIGSGTFVQDRRDDPTDAHRGWLNTIDSSMQIGFSGQAFCSADQTSTCIQGRPVFNRTIARNSTYHRLSRDVVFARFLSIGAIGRFTAAGVPLPERIFGGGANSHRGFGESQAGPRDTYTGFPVGGNALVTNTLELRFPLLGDNVGGVVFHDMGNVYSNFSKISFRGHQDTTIRIDPATNTPNISDFDYTVHAAGFGIRYRTPIGPLRLDLAYTINPPRFYGFQGSREDLLTPGKGVRTLQQLSHFQFHFSLGQAF